MKVVLLAGGMGTRLNNSPEAMPKPLTLIGNHPILLHIMHVYCKYGYKDFVVCLGYRGYDIKKFFGEFRFRYSDVTIHPESSDYPFYESRLKLDGLITPATVTLVDTGLTTTTGGRIKRIQQHIGDNPFMMTYGDTLSDVDIDSLVEFHKSKPEPVTMTIVQPKGRFGVIKVDGLDKITSFVEKPAHEQTWVNGGFFVLEPEVFNYLDEDGDFFEGKPLETLVGHDKVNCFKHFGFWHAMDTPKDREELDRMIMSNRAIWI